MGEAKKLFARGSEKFPRSIELAITRETGLNIIKAEAPATICEYVSLLIYSHNKANIIEVVDTHMQESKARLKRLARYNKENKIRLKKKVAAEQETFRYLFDITYKDEDEVLLENLINMEHKTFDV